MGEIFGAVTTVMFRGQQCLEEYVLEEYVLEDHAALEGKTEVHPTTLRQHLSRTPMADHSTAHLGSVYQFNLQASGRGNISIEVEDIPHPDFPGIRPKKLWGTAAVVHAPARDASLFPVAVDEDSWATLKEASFEGGHLIGLHYGGPDNQLNIAPMCKGANSGTGTWGAIEKALKAHLTGLGFGQSVYVEVNIGYDNSVDPRIPCRVQGFVQTQVGGVGAGPKSVINTYIGPPSDQTNFVNKPVMNFFRDLEQEAAATGYGTLVATPRTPNAPLDVIDYKSKVGSQNLRGRLRNLHPLFANYPLNGFRKKPGLSVGKEQRLLMMLYNRYRNLKGVMKASVLTAEDAENLGLMLPEWQAQYDHTKTKSSGGKNTYSNLVLTHHRVNNKRGAGGTGLRYHFKRRSRKPVRLTYV